MCVCVCVYTHTHVVIDSNLSGGAPGQGNVVSRAMIDGLCAMADIVPVTAQVIVLQFLRLATAKAYGRK